MENPPNNLSKIIQSLLDWIFPSACLSCNAWLSRGAVYCGKCFDALPRFRVLYCGKCRARLGEDKKVCHKDFPYLLGAATDYRNPGVSALVAALKFKSARAAAEPMAVLLAQYAESLLLTPYAAIVPIPLSPSRLRERGFNQAEILAATLAQKLHIPILTSALRRIKNTRPQSEIHNAEERAANVKNCFAVSESARVSEKNIILVDDVVTSGATILEAARALKAAGAKRIIALVAAKA